MSFKYMTQSIIFLLIIHLYFSEKLYIAAFNKEISMNNTEKMLKENLNLLIANLKQGHTASFLFRN